MKRIISRFTMKRKQSEFIDKIDGELVCSYIDRYGDEYLAAYPFFLLNFRVKIN